MNVKDGRAKPRGLSYAASLLVLTSTGGTTQARRRTLGWGSSKQNRRPARPGLPDLDYLHRPSIKRRKASGRHEGHNTERRLESLHAPPTAVPTSVRRLTSQNVLQEQLCPGCAAWAFSWTAGPTPVPSGCRPTVSVFPPRLCVVWESGQWRPRSTAREPPRPGFWE